MRILLFCLLLMTASCDSNPFQSDWPAGFNIVTIGNQKAYYYPAKNKNKPLIVSLHTWSGNFEQKDRLALLIQKEGWNYIHPDFRGPNNNRMSCLSELVIQDIDNAIDFAVKNGADVNNIYILGSSGGGYATVGMYYRSKYPVRAFLAWVPITNLVDWYRYSASKNIKYAKDILACTGSTTVLNQKEAEKRSPIFWKPIDRKGRLEIYAGVNDDIVPVSQSINLFNKLTGKSASLKAPPPKFSIDGRSVLLFAEDKNISLTIFDGKHEMLEFYSIKRLKELVGADANQ